MHVTLVGVCLSKSTIQYAAAVGEELLTAASQGKPPPALMGDIFTPSHPTSTGSLQREPTDLLRSSQQLFGLPESETSVGSDAESRVGLPAVAGGFSSNTNTSSAPASLGAGEADSRAGFCGAAPTGAPLGASSAVRPSSQPLGADLSALLPAVAGGFSSNNNNFSSNTPQHLPQLVLRELTRAQVSAAQLPLALYMERLLLHVQHPKPWASISAPCCLL